MRLVSGCKVVGWGGGLVWLTMTLDVLASQCLGGVYIGVMR
jgi:hypothetical protein